MTSGAVALPYTPHVNRARVVAFAVLASTVIAGCATDAGTSSRLSAVPQSEWPAIDGVEVTSARSSSGSTCCESQDGSLALRLNLPEQHPYSTLRSGLRAAGWMILKCDFRRPGNFYIARDGLNGWTDTSSDNRHGADLFVMVQRGGPVSDFQPRHC